MYYTPISIAYIYIYALVGGAISIRDPYTCIYISVRLTSLCQRIAWYLPQARCLCCENVVIVFKTSIEAYFVGKTALGRLSCSRLANYAITFERNVFS